MTTQTHHLKLPIFSFLCILGALKIRNEPKASSRIPLRVRDLWTLFLQIKMKNKAKYPHFQLKINGYRKKQSQFKPISGGTFKRSLRVFLRNEPKPDCPTMKKRNEPKPSSRIPLRVRDLLISLLQMKNEQTNPFLKSIYLL
jgi:hypothetical protein